MKMLVLNKVLLSWDRFKFKPWTWKKLHKFLNSSVGIIVMFTLGGLFIRDLGHIQVLKNDVLKGYFSLKFFFPPGI